MPNSLCAAIALVLVVGLSTPAWAGDGPAGAPARLSLLARRQVEAGPGAARYRRADVRLDWRADQTAFVICDMWDQHWCKSATARVAEMAPRVDELAGELRRLGALIIHCPSDVVDFYADHPGRALARQAPKIDTAVPLQDWCPRDPRREPPLPIDDSDGGCDCLPQCENRRAWSRQIDTIEIRDGDAITDSAEAFYLMKQRGIRNVIVAGVHANICVLGRPFSIRQMVQQGQQRPDHRRHPPPLRRGPARTPGAVATRSPAPQVLLRVRAHLQDQGAAGGDGRVGEAGLGQGSAVQDRRLDVDVLRGVSPGLDDELAS